MRVGVVFSMSLFVILTLFSSHSSAAINPQINFQGKLTNTDGTNVTNGTLSIEQNTRADDDRRGLAGQHPGHEEDQGYGGGSHGGIVPNDQACLLTRVAQKRQNPHTSRAR